MKLQHYLGGFEGLGPVTYEKRVFVEPWVGAVDEGLAYERGHGALSGSLPP
jgi:hypothetical protein